MAIKREYDFEGRGQKGYVPAASRGDRIACGQLPPEVKRIRFFMTFGQSYLTHMKCLENVGMLSTTPIDFEGRPIVPIQFLKALLPDPATLGPRTKGKTNIGCIFTGVKDGKEKEPVHLQCLRPRSLLPRGRLTGHLLHHRRAGYDRRGACRLGRVEKAGRFFHHRAARPRPFMDALNRFGLPWVVEENPRLVD